MPVQLDFFGITLDLYEFREFGDRRVRHHEKYLLIQFLRLTDCG